jgi:hypothetical protein
MVADGWVLWKGGKHYFARCPHGHPKEGTGAIGIACTPKNDAWHALQLQRRVAKCPERHDYL